MKLSKCKWSQFTLIVSQTSDREGKDILHNWSSLCSPLLFCSPLFSAFFKVFLKNLFPHSSQPELLLMSCFPVKVFMSFLFRFSCTFMLLRSQCYIFCWSFLLPAFWLSASLIPFLSQAPCENLRTPSTYPGNMLPHHPGQGNFEDFTCWAEPRWKCVLCNQSHHTTTTVQRREGEELILI